MNSLQTLNKVFENIILRIPDYQRGYSWDKKHLDALWNDLSNVNVFVENSYHFTGIITLDRFSSNNLNKLESEGFKIENNEIIISNEKYEAYNIVDGQQRLTTLLILISLLISSLESHIENEKISLLKKKFLGVNVNEKHYYIFGYEKDIPSYQFLIAKIFDDDSMVITEPETIYTKNLENTKKYFLTEKLIHLDDKQRFNLLIKITEKLLFYVFVIENDKLDMSLVFETLNYRGKELSKLEVFKNRLIFLVSKRYISEQQSVLRNKIIKTWQDIYEWLGKNEKNKLEDDDFLRAFWILYFNHDLDKEKELKQFEFDLFENKFSIINIKENKLLELPKIEKFLNDLSKSIKIWFLINNPYYENNIEELNFSNKIKDSLFLIEKNNIGDYMKILCLAILFKHDFDEQENGISSELINEIERHNFVVYLLCGKQADTNRPEILRYINQFFRGNITKDNLKYIITNLIIKHLSFENIHNHIHNNHQKNMKFHDWKGIKYLMWNYENYLKNNSEINFEDYTNFNTSLIFPDLYGFGVQFPNVTRNRYGDDLKTLTYSLGNITISKRKNNPLNFNNLKPLLLKGSASDKEIYNYNEWTDENIYNRGLKILNFIENHWKIKIGNESQKRNLLIEKLRIQTAVNEEE